MAVIGINFGNCCYVQWGVTEWLLSADRYNQICICKDDTLIFVENKIVRAKARDRKAKLAVVFIIQSRT